MKKLEEELLKLFLLCSVVFTSIVTFITTKAIFGVPGTIFKNQSLDPTELFWINTAVIAGLIGIVSGVAMVVTSIRNQLTMPKVV